MDEIAVARRTGGFLKYELDDLVCSTGMQREWIPNLGEKLVKHPFAPYELEFNPLNDVNNERLPAEIRNKIKINYSISTALRTLCNDKRHPYQKILILKYFDVRGLTNPEIADKIGYSVHVFYEKKRQALVEFSTAFLNAQKRYNVNPLIDLVNAPNKKLTSDSNVVSFLNTLSDKQALNLYATLLQAKSSISTEQAKKRATSSYSFDRLKSMLIDSL